MPKPATPRYDTIFSDPDAIMKGPKRHMFRLRITDDEKLLVDTLCRATGKTEAEVGHAMFKYMAMVVSVSPICQLLGCPAKMSVVAQVPTESQSGVPSMTR